MESIVSITFTEKIIWKSDCLFLALQICVLWTQCICPTFANENENACPHLDILMGLFRSASGHWNAINGWVCNPLMQFFRSEDGDVLIINNNVTSKENIFEIKVQ